MCKSLHKLNWRKPQTQTMILFVFMSAMLITHKIQHVYLTQHVVRPAKLHKRASAQIVGNMKWELKVKVKEENRKVFWLKCIYLIKKKKKVLTIKSFKTFVYNLQLFADRQSILHLYSTIFFVIFKCFVLFVFIYGFVLAQFLYFSYSLFNASYVKWLIFTKCSWWCS